MALAYLDYFMMSKGACCGSALLAAYNEAYKAKPTIHGFSTNVQ